MAKSIAAMFKNMTPKKKTIVIVTSAVLALVLIATPIVLILINGSKPSGTGYSNEETPLVFSSEAADGVFNPFFSSTGVDGNIVGMTQLAMLGNDSAGGYVYGDGEEVITKDLEITTVGTGDDAKTTYKFVLKNGIKFSDGKPLTIKDVLFNYYVYLDPVYTGSSTLYSTDIVGLKEYRTQAADENEQEKFEVQFVDAARTRVSSLLEAFNHIDGSSNEATYLSAEAFRAKLVEYKADAGAAYQNIDVDFDKALELFKKELQSDYNNSKDSYQEFKLYGEDGTVHENVLTSDVEMFLYNEGKISWNRKGNGGKGEITFNYDRNAIKTEAQAINLIYDDNIPGKLDEVVSFWATASDLIDYLKGVEMSNYYADNEMEYKSVSGIQFANRTGSITVNGVAYNVPTYNADGSVKDGNEVLSITINGVDPKAIWNFGISVAPLHYYSGSFEGVDYVSGFNFVDNFGVKYADPDFMNGVVNGSKCDVPVGAGAYAASKASGGLENVGKGDFFSNNVVYYERNPYYTMGGGENGLAKIKNLRYQVVPIARLLDSLKNNEVDFAEPNAKPETMTDLDNSGISHKEIDTSGYGYIGVNAGKIPSIYVRRAIMYSIDIMECVNYYKTMAQPIYRSMSTANWAYPKDSTAYYPYIGGTIPEDLSVVDPYYADYVAETGHTAGQKFTEAEQKEFIRRLLEDEAGYVLTNGVYADASGKNKCEFIFTISGEDLTDHPAYPAFNKARTFLNKCGFSVTVAPDRNALSKLSSGSLTVWAAAWGSTIDPDMYQVYHKDSKATSVLNWGYKQILNDAAGKYDYENEIITELSELIDAARDVSAIPSVGVDPATYKKNVESYRSSIYKDALTMVMELAVELPTYQRKDMFAYNQNKLDASTFNSDLSPYKGLTSNLTSISLLVK